jgi:hypothetical protein
MIVRNKHKILSQPIVFIQLDNGPILSSVFSESLLTLKFKDFKSQ